MRHALSGARHRIFLPGKLGDLGLALLVLWLVAQINPGIPLFAVTFDAGQRATAATSRYSPPRRARRRARRSSRRRSRRFQLLGVGLFLALLLRERRYIGGAVLLLIGGALLAKGVAAMLVLKPCGVGDVAQARRVDRHGGGAPGAAFVVFLPRPVQVAICAIALLASLLLPVLAVDLPSRARAAHAVQLALRPSAQLQRPHADRCCSAVAASLAAAWLFVLAGPARAGASRMTACARL